MQFSSQWWWNSCCCNQFHTYSQWFAAKVVVLNFSIAAKFSKCLTWADLSNITVSQVCLKVFPCNFLLNSAESHVIVTSFTPIHSGLQQNVLFKFFNSCKMLKMLKIGCFKQNYCISGKPQGIPMQFFAQQRWKSCSCDHFYTYSQWFAAKVVVLNFSIAAKFSKCLKWADLSKITVSQVCLKVFPCNFLLNSAESHVVVYQFYTYSQWFAAKFVILNFSIAEKCSKCLK